MREKESLYAVDQIVRVVALVPVYSFVLALSFEAFFSVGLGFNALQYYVPSDFFSASIRFVLPTAIPLIIYFVALAIGVSAIDRKFSNQTSSAEKAHAAWPLVIVAAISVTITLLFGILSTVSAMLMYLVLTISILQVLRRSAAKPQAIFLFLLAFLLLGVTMLNGFKAGKSIWSGRIENLPRVNVVSSSNNPVRLVRLLANGALLVEQDSHFSFIQLSQIKDIRTEPLIDEWPGLFCPLLNDCAFLGGLREWDGIIRIDLN